MALSFERGSRPPCPRRAGGLLCSRWPGGRGGAWVTAVSAPRAPVLVALALIESGMKYEDAIQFIRQ